MKRPQKQLLLEINGSVYKVTGRAADKLIKIAKEKFIESNSYAIVALKKNGKVFMTKHTYDSATQFKIAHKGFKDAGFRVYYVKPEGERND